MKKQMDKFKSINNFNVLKVFLDRKNIIKMDDREYLKSLYEIKMKKKLELDNPKTFNEKLQWLKLYDRKDIYTTMVDKYEVKEYVKNIIGEEYIIPTIGVYDSFDKIDFDKLPNQFVIKCTHDSGSTIICKDKNEFNIKRAKKDIERCIDTNFFYTFREWPYKNVKPRIIIEKYMKNSNDDELIDYKFYCFNGKVDYVMICTGRQQGDTKFYYYNDKWELQKDMSYDGINLKGELSLEKPINLDKMFEMVRNLSKGFKFIRIDLYEIQKKIYFGEFTFFPSAGFDNGRTTKAEKYLNDSLKI